MNNVHLPYEIHPMQLKVSCTLLNIIIRYTLFLILVVTAVFFNTVQSGAPGAEHLVYLNNQMTAQQQVALFHHQQQQQQQQFRNGQVSTIFTIYFTRL